MSRNQNLPNKNNQRPPQTNNNKDSNNTIVANNSEQARLRTKQLVLKETLIGRVEGKWKNIPMNFNIYYGNYCVPDRKIEDIDDMLMLPIAQYINLLKQFLASKRGKEFIIPNVEQINNDVMLIRTEYNLNKRKEEASKDDDVNDKDSNDTANIVEQDAEIDESNLNEKFKDDSKTIEQENINDVENETSQTLTKTDNTDQLTDKNENPKESCSDEIDNLNVEKDHSLDAVKKGDLKDSNKKSRFNKKNKDSKSKKEKAKNKVTENVPISFNSKVLKILFVMLVINILCLGFNAYQFLNLTQLNKSNITEQIQVEINGQEMILPMNKYDLNVGETRINLYAISSTQTEDGLVNNAFPLGELNFTDSE